MNYPDGNHPVFWALTRALVQLPKNIPHEELLVGIASFVANTANSLCSTDRTEDVLGIVMVVASAALDATRSLREESGLGEPSLDALATTSTMH